MDLAIEAKRGIVLGREAKCCGSRSDASRDIGFKSGEFVIELLDTQGSSDVVTDDRWRLRCDIKGDGN